VTLLAGHRLEKTTFRRERFDCNPGGRTMGNDRQAQFNALTQTDKSGNERLFSLSCCPFAVSLSLLSLRCSAYAAVLKLVSFRCCPHAAAPALIILSSRCCPYTIDLAARTTAPARAPLHRTLISRPLCYSSREFWLLDLVHCSSFED
jgi:hypothetical protein